MVVEKTGPLISVECWPSKNGIDRDRHVGKFHVMSVESHVIPQSGVWHLQAICVPRFTGQLEEGKGGFWSVSQERGSINTPVSDAHSSRM